MTRDASLDEFLGGDDDHGDDDDHADSEDAEESTDWAATEDAAPDVEEDAADTPNAGPDDETPDDSEWLPPAEVEPARSTYDWSPDGAACASCGATVEARWRGEQGLVCADCKEW